LALRLSGLPGKGWWWVVEGSQSKVVVLVFGLLWFT
jgi:hypothetical protein